MALRFATLHKSSAYLISGLGLGTLLFSREMGPVAMLLVPLAYAASWFCEGPALHSSRALRAWNLATIGLLALQVVRAVLGTSPVVVGVEFAAFLQINRLCNRRSARDYQQITVLAFLHLVAATVLVSDLSYAVCFGGFVLVAPWALSLGHLRREIEGNYLVEHRPGAGAAHVEVGRILASRRIIGPGFLVATAALSIPLFLITASLFLLFPRLGIGVFGGFGRPATRLSGFSDRIELGGFGAIRSDPTVVMRIELPASLGRPARLGMYWRGTSFDRYDGASWSRTDATSWLLPSDGRRQHMITRFARPEDFELKIFLEPIEPPVLFVPEGTVALGIPPAVRGGAPVFRAVDRFDGDELRYRDPGGAGLEYDVYLTSPDQWPRPRALDGPERKRYLQLPRLDPRVRELAENLTRGIDGDLDRAERIARYLRERYRYTLELPGTGRDASIEEFLFRRKRGHCEYFSTAMAALLRSIGIPTRNVSGFFGGEKNRYGGYYSIRQGDAHSWVEVYVEGKGWRTFDPTPPAATAPRPGGLSDRISDAIDALRLKWMQYVLSYGLNDQLALSRTAFDLLRDARDRVGRIGGERVPRWVPWGIAALLLAVAIALALRRRTRGLFAAARAARGPRREPPAVSLYRRLEDAMGRAGHPRSPATTPLEHARHLRDRAVPGWQIVERVTDRYVGARFGSRALDVAEIRALERAIGELRRSAGVGTMPGRG
ncbi:MAG: DUF3488 domain-containing protein [Deltaproteobacteria bacterium]|nr:DUF3488 domain-containing protein [Deltaproteobacteria bacterium]